MTLLRTLLLTFILVPIVNFGIFIFDPEGQRFDQGPEVLFEPAGYAFSIWSLIFIGMIIWAYQVMKQLSPDQPAVKKAAIAAISAGLASICFAPLSLQPNQIFIWINILWHLISLILLFHYNQSLRDISKVSRWYFIGPQMYLGWICAAFAVSTALLLRYLGVQFTFESEQGITIALISALGILGFFMAMNRGGTVSLVLVWALIGLAVESSNFTNILTSCAMASFFILLAISRAKRLGKEFI